MLAARRVAVEPAAKATDKPSRTAQADDGDRGIGDVMKDPLFGTKRRQGMIETLAKQTARTVGTQMGRKILRGLLGGIIGGQRQRPWTNRERPDSMGKREGGERVGTSV